jgi:hypothetical protein
MYLKASAVVVMLLKIFWVVAVASYHIYIPPPLLTQSLSEPIITHHTSPSFLIGSSIQYYPLDPTPI